MCQVSWLWGTKQRPDIQGTTCPKSAENLKTHLKNFPQLGLESDLVQFLLLVTEDKEWWTEHLQATQQMTTE